jgi:uncharacterized protein
MPIITSSSYRPNPMFLRSGHLETIVPSLLQRELPVPYARERMELADGDFLDLDWFKKGNSRLVILSSGMEGNSARPYMTRAAKYFYERGWDALAWNYRGCSGELNRLPKTYSYADTHDFRAVIDHAIQKRKYQQVALIGFSMGGCLVTKYLGEAEPDKRIIGSASFSVSCDLKDSMEATARPSNFIYYQYYIKKLREKLQAKAAHHASINAIPIEKIKVFDDYLRYYSIPFHGFKDADDFYVQSSCAQFIPTIKTPSLIVNALNDPMLAKGCYPYEMAKSSEHFFLESPSCGGHIAFPLASAEYSWMEHRAWQFFSSLG